MEGYCFFYEVSVPMRSYTLDPNGNRGKANQPPATDDALRVVECKNGRELGRIRYCWLPTA